LFYDSVSDLFFFIAAILSEGTELSPSSQLRQHSLYL
jgi:hypothetical protein